MGCKGSNLAKRVKETEATDSSAAEADASAADAPQENAEAPPEVEEAESSCLEALTKPLKKRRSRSASAKLGQGTRQSTVGAADSAMDDVAARSTPMEESCDHATLAIECEQVCAAPVDEDVAVQTVVEGQSASRTSRKSKHRAHSAETAETMKVIEARPYLTSKASESDPEPALADTEATDCPPTATSRESLERRAESGRFRNPISGLWRSLQDGYEELVCAIIRPPRAQYELQELGRPIFEWFAQKYCRRDLQIKNFRGLTLECSWWGPEHLLGEGATSTSACPCVVYLHGNSSCRLEAMDHLRAVLPLGATLMAFDFSGSGMSEGETISLGYNEQDDSRAVVEYLRSTGLVTTVALWGRSMGAATALLHASHDLSIAALVVDSPFASLERVVREVIDRSIRHKPPLIASAAIGSIRSSIRKRVGVDISTIRPIERVSSCFVPLLLIHSREDELIDAAHSKDIYEKYAGDKNLVMVGGRHNARRPAYLEDSVAIFLSDRLCFQEGGGRASDEPPTASPMASPKSKASALARTLSFRRQVKMQQACREVDACRDLVVSRDSDPSSVGLFLERVPVLPLVASGTPEPCS